MKKPEKPIMFIGNDELNQKMIARYRRELNRYQHWNRVVVFVAIVVLLVLLGIAGAEL